MPTFYYQPSLYLYDQIEKLICPHTWTLSSGTPLTDWRSHLCYSPAGSQFTAASVCFPPAEKAQSLDPANEPCFCFRHGCEDQRVCGGLIQNGNEWAKTLWGRGEEEHILLVPGFFQVIISPIVLTIKQFLLLLISKAYYIKLHFLLVKVN